MNILSEKYPEEIQAILAKYPADQKRSAVMPLLYLAQRENGYVTKAIIGRDCRMILGLSATEVASIVGFYSLYYDEPAGRVSRPGLHRSALRAARRRRIPGKAVREPGHPGG